MKNIEDRDFIKIEKQNIRNLNPGQRIYLTGYNTKLKRPTLIIGDFSQSSGDFLTLNNYSYKYVEFNIESSWKPDAFQLLNIIHKYSSKIDTNSFTLTRFKDLKIWI